MQSANSNIKDYQAAPDLLKDRVILVTGAGQGLGRAIAIACANHGATVLLSGRQVAKLETVYDEIIAAGSPEPVIFSTDLATAQDKDYESIANSIGWQLKRLDGIVHSASLFYNLSPLSIQTSEQWLDLFRVNALAPFALTRACEPLLKRSPDASVILVGESHGQQPAAFWGGFAVSKAAMETYLKIQADEWQDQLNLRVNLLIPGPIHSPHRSRTHPGEFKETLAKPEELAPYFLYLLGMDGRNTRGAVIDCHKDSGVQDY